MSFSQLGHHTINGVDGQYKVIRKVPVHDCVAVVKLRLLRTGCYLGIETGDLASTNGGSWHRP